jgi:hypothetical protein
MTISSRSSAKADASERPRKPVPPAITIFMRASTPLDARKFLV